jgi:hypothetical protein
MGAYRSTRYVAYYCLPGIKGERGGRNRMWIGPRRTTMHAHEARMFPTTGSARNALNYYAPKSAISRKVIPVTVEWDTP